MPKVLTAAFPHRHNHNGSFDSICRACFATVASVTEERELEFYESKHRCDPVTLYKSLMPAPSQRCQPANR